MVYGVFCVSIDIMDDIKFFRIQKQRGNSPCWHCEPTVESHTTTPAQLTMALIVEKYLLNRGGLAM